MIIIPVQKLGTITYRGRTTYVLKQSELDIKLPKRFEVDVGLGIRVEFELSAERHDKILGDYSVYDDEFVYPSALPTRNSIATIFLIKD